MKSSQSKFSNEKSLSGQKPSAGTKASSGCRCGSKLPEEVDEIEVMEMEEN